MRSALWSVVAAFGAYFCMYGFRKPFTAATYADPTLWGMSFKAVLVIAQVMGYMLSKFIGIRVVAAMPPGRRAIAILILIAIAELALFLFGLVPAPLNLVCLFLNGLPLGMVFGLVLGFLEGRRETEALAAGLCASFIVADGVTKSVGRQLLNWGIDEFWMPAVAGLIFAGPLLVFVAMLTRIRPPSAADIASRSSREPMSLADRRGLFRRYAFGWIALIFAYLMITVLRSLRADFQPEIWDGLGVHPDPELYSYTEILVAIGVTVLFGTVVFIRDNRLAFSVGMALSLAGVALIGATLLLRTAMSEFAFMVAIGLGIYLPYVAVHTTIFERFIAMTRDRGNIGYLLYLADAFGYLGYVAVVLGKNVFGGPADFLSFFLAACAIVAAGAAVLLAASWIYFAKHPAAARKA